MMAFEHLKLKLLDGEFKYVLFEKPESFWNALETIKSESNSAPAALFSFPGETSLLVPQHSTISGDKQESGWIGLKIEGEMPFGTVQGLISSISEKLKGADIGVCVVSSFLTDIFFIRSQHRSRAISALEAGGWTVLH